MKHYDEMSREEQRAAIAEARRPTVGILLCNVHRTTAVEALHLDKLDTDREYVEMIVEYIEWLLSGVKKIVGGYYSSKTGPATVRTLLRNVYFTTAEALYRGRLDTREYVEELVECLEQLLSTVKEIASGYED